MQTLTEYRESTRDFVLDALASGISQDDIILAVHSAFKVDRQDSNIHYLLTSMKALTTGRYVEQLDMAISFNWNNPFSSEEYARALYKAGANHLMIPYHDEDSVIKLFAYVNQMQNWAVVERMCTKATNIFVMRQL